MKLYWWNGKPNLGDVFNRILFPQAEWAAPPDADWAGVGSVLENFHGFTGTVFGTGRAGIHFPPIDLTQATVLALRGRETRQRVLVSNNDMAFGDPGLLASDYYEREQGSYVAIVPHWTDQERMLTLYPGARFVDVMGNPHKALRAIAGAERVVASALHGIVFADAFGIPRMWDWFEGCQAGGFKFVDYMSVVGRFEPGQWVEADSARIQVIQKELRECLVSV